jgi:hypothetical protein
MLTFTAMTVHTRRRPTLVKAASDAKKTLSDKKIARTARSEHEDPDWIARVDQAHKSARGHRGGNFGNN